MRKRLLVTFIPLILFPLMGVGALSYFLAKKALTEKVIAQLEAIASLQKSRVENINERNLERLALVADQLKVRIAVDRYLPYPSKKNKEQMNRVLKQVRVSTPYFKTLSILSPKGKVIASTAHSFIDEDYSKDPFFKKGKFGNRFDVVGLGEDQLNGAYFLGPLKLDGALMGYVLIEENLDLLFPELKDYSGLGTTGETYLGKALPDERILFLTSLRFDPSAALVKVVGDNQKLPISQALAQNEGTILSATDYRDHDVLATTRFIKAMKWGLVVKIDRDEAFYPVTRLRDFLFIFLLLSTFIASFLAFYLARSVVDPIKEDLEKKVEVRTGELQQSRLFYDSIFENIPHMIFVKDAKDLRFVSFNKAGEKLLGMNREELIGKNDYDFFPPHEADFFTEKDRGVLRSGKMLDIPEEPIHTKSGVRYLHTKKIPMIDQSGLPQYLLGISEDVTERRDTEKSLLQKQSELARSIAEREQLSLFASIAAHDLQEPLRKITAFGDLLMAECVGSINESGKHYLARMRSAAKRMSELISDLLKFSKITSAEAEREVVDIKSVIEEVLSDLELRIQETGAQIHVGDMPPITANRVQLREVFQNLIGNAIKFRKKNEPPEINVQSRETTSGDLEISVEDKGIGFDQKFADRIFKPFERLHSRGEYDGSGIGLAVCHRVISRLGGTMSVRSAIGEGAAFTILLPKTVRAKGGAAVATESAR